jgi:hypothetical protein
MEGHHARYLKKDVEAAVDEVEDFLALIEAEVPGAAENYQTFLLDTAARCDKNNIVRTFVNFPTISQIGVECAKSQRMGARRLY